MCKVDDSIFVKPLEQKKKRRNLYLRECLKANLKRDLKCSRSRKEYSLPVSGHKGFATGMHVKKDVNLGARHVIKI